MPEGIISASAPPEPDNGEQARFDQALESLLDTRYPTSDTSEIEHPPGFAPDPDPVQEVEGVGSSLPPSSDPLTPPVDDEPQEPVQELDPAGGPTDLDLPAEVPPSTEDAPAPIDGGTDLNRIFEAYLGSIPTPDQTVELLNFVTAVQALPPDRQALMERIMRGEDPSPTPAPHAPVPGPTTPDYGVDDDEPQDPRVAALEQRLAAIEADRQAAEQQQYQQWVAYEREATKGAALSYAQTQQLDQNDLAILEAKVHQLGTYGAMLRNHNNDPAQAYAAALDLAYWATPSFRQRAMQSAPNPERDAQDQDRKVLASAVSAASAAGAKPLSPEGPRTLQEAKRAAIAELAGAFEP